MTCCIKQLCNCKKINACVIMLSSLGSFVTRLQKLSFTNPKFSSPYAGDNFQRLWSGLQWYLERDADRLTQLFRSANWFCLSKQVLMKKQNCNNLKVSVNCFTAENHRRKRSLVNLLLLNAAASSDTVDGEDSNILLSEAAGGGNEQWIISHQGCRVVGVLLQDGGERNRYKSMELPFSCGIIGTKDSMKQSWRGKKKSLNGYLPMLIKWCLQWLPKQGTNKTTTYWVYVSSPACHYCKPRNISHILFPLCFSPAVCSPLGAAISDKMYFCPPEPEGKVGQVWFPLSPQQSSIQDVVNRSYRLEIIKENV